MSRRKAVRRAAAVAPAIVALLSLPGCAAIVGGYDLAPNGLTRDEHGFRQAIAHEAPKAYRTAINGTRALPDDDLLRLLYAGIAGRYAGAHQESSRLLDVASYLAEDRVTTSVSREALSFITSDRALAYTPARAERLMIPYLAALNFLDGGDLEGAAVEARRIEALLDQLDGDLAPDDRPNESRFLHYFAASVFDAAGDWNAADVAFRRAGRLTDALGRPGTIPAEAGADPGLEPVVRTVADTGTGEDRDVGLGDVIVLVESGFVPHRVEQSVIVVLPPEQARMLTDGSAGERVLAAGEAAARILLTAALVYGDRSGYYQGPGYRSPLHLDPWAGDRCRDGRWAGQGGLCRPAADDEDDGSPYLLRISWPVLYREPAPVGAVRVRAGTLSADAAARLDLADAVRRDFDDQRSTILTRTVVRAAGKMALSSGVEQRVAKRDEAAGHLAGLLTNLGTLLTERADTRSWHLLPGTISMARLQLPAGNHDLTIESAHGRTVSLGSVTVRPGETTFVSTRLWH